VSTKYIWSPKLFEGPFQPVAMIEHYATQRCELTEGGWRFVGPIYKQPDSYMTEDGYLLGSTTWYVQMEWRGWRWNIYGQTFGKALANAHAVIKEVGNNPISHDDYKRLCVELGEHRRLSFEKAKTK
jgi:hypothetical protein